MTSNYRAHQRQAIIRTLCIVPKYAWRDLRWLLRHFTPKQWMRVYNDELADIQMTAFHHEANSHRLTRDDFVFDEIPF